MQLKLHIEFTKILGQWEKNGSKGLKLKWLKYAFKQF
jgi:hypothetical protein